MFMNEVFGFLIFKHLLIIRTENYHQFYTLLIENELDNVMETKSKWSSRFSKSFQKSFCVLTMIKNNICISLSFIVSLVHPLSIYSIHFAPATKEKL